MIWGNLGFERAEMKGIYMTGQEYYFSSTSLRKTKGLNPPGPWDCVLDGVTDGTGSHRPAWFCCCHALEWSCPGQSSLWQRKNALCFDMLKQCTTCSKKHQGGYYSFKQKESAGDGVFAIPQLIEWKLSITEWGCLKKTFKQPLVQPSVSDHSCAKQMINLSLPTSILWSAASGWGWITGDWSEFLPDTISCTWSSELFIIVREEEGKRRKEVRH